MNIIYPLLAFFLGIFGAKWSPIEALKPPPPTKQLTALQTDLTKAQADAEAARKAQTDAIAAERAKNDAQGRAIQESNALALAAAQSLPDAQKTAETRLTEEMIARTDWQLAVQLGKLSDVDRASIAASIGRALAGQRAAFDAEIAKRDAAFKAVSAERDAAKADVTATTTRAVKAEETANATQAKVTEVTNKVKATADALDAKAREAGSLGGALDSAMTGLKWVIGIAVVIGCIALYLRMGLGSVGRALHPLQAALPADQYAKVVSALDGETDKLHQYLIAGGRKAEAFLHPHSLPPSA